MAKKKLPKKPKKPSGKAGLVSWQRFNERVSEWRKKCNGINADEKKRATLIKKYANGVK